MVSEDFRAGWRHAQLFYIHVPKTAGTSLFAALSSIFGSDKCAEHLESELLPEPPDGIADQYGHMRLLSAHVPIDFAQPFIERDFAPITTIREPDAQFHSHVQHILATAPPGGLLGEIRQKLGVSIGHFLDHATDAELEFFENSQSKPIFGSMLDWRALPVAERLDWLAANYAAVLPTERLDQDLASLADWPAGLSLPVLNTRRYQPEPLQRRHRLQLDAMLADDRALHSALLRQVDAP